MKNLLIILISITALFLSNNESLAQYAIPSYNVKIVTEPTTFEESVNSLSIIIPNTHRKPVFVQMQNSDEERKINVQVSSSTPGQSANATVQIYSLDEQDILGPFYVTDESILEQPIDNREWGIVIINSSENCKLSTWID